MRTKLNWQSQEFREMVAELTKTHSEQSLAEHLGCTRNALHNAIVRYDLPWCAIKTTTWGRKPKQKTVHHHDSTPYTRRLAKMLALQERVAYLRRWQEGAA